MGVLGQRVLVQVVEVVVLPEGVEGDLPVGADRVHVGLAVGLPVGEVEHGQLVGQPGAEVGVDVDGRPGPQAADDQAVALGDGELDQALVLAVHPLEALGHRHADEAPFEVVHPGVEGAGEPPRLAAAVGDPDPTVAAHVRHRPHLALGVPGQQDRGPAQVDGAVGARPGQRARQAEHQRVVEEEDVELGLEVGLARCRRRRAPRARRRPCRWCRCRGGRAAVEPGRAPALPCPSVLPLTGEIRTERVLTHRSPWLRRRHPHAPVSPLDVRSAGGLTPLDLR